MAQLREIKKRIKAVGNIQRITKTMQMIATAKFQASVRRAQGTKPYTTKLAEIVGELASAVGDEVDHPLLGAGRQKTGRELLLVLSSNRGLCGAYNANILRTSMHYLRDHTDVTHDLEVVGKKGIAFFRFAGMEPKRAHTQFTDKPAYEDVEAVASSYIDQYVAGEYDAVRVAYMQFISNARQVPMIEQLLPLQPPTSESGESAGGTRAVYEFSPDPAELLAELLPMSVKSRLFQWFNDAVVSEQISRMVAMKAATDNAGKLSRSLKRGFNRARQAQITTELSEIIGGAAALS
ncbi:ATP synthase F1 subunit gamma [Planctomycetales bacterium ZRK34]|nr:ATP synthase F1 subunit gamma [Planctomycetales bacterium ZRK34]